MNFLKNKTIAAVMTAVLLVIAFAASMAEAAFTPLAIDAQAGGKPLEESYLPDMGGYEDSSLRVTIETMRQHETNILVARVKIADPSQIRTTMAARYGSTGTVLPDRLAKRVNAVLAINGDFFNFNSTGYLVRQGKLYRDKTHTPSDILIIDDKGDFTIIVDPTEEVVKGFEGTIINSFNFGPALVVDGEIIHTTKDLNVGLDKETQRMGIAQVGPLEYICVATEGPENEGSDGLTIPEFAQLMKDLGAVQAYNLDGGSSSAMMLGGEKINALSSKKMRPICDLLYFATLAE
ncbi:MAG: phosphodiester glycosidase family protein [Clostridia bacterium]|nr:phosphodiester glycosidase family protein [Clostridia bacterium]